jgi:hypothetical protein
MAEDAAALGGDVRLLGQPIEPNEDILRIMDGLLRPIGNGQGDMPGGCEAACDPIVCRDHALLHATWGNENSRVHAGGVRSGDLRWQAERTIMQFYTLFARHRRVSFIWRRLRSTRAGCEAEEPRCPHQGHAPQKCSSAPSHHMMVTHELSFLLHDLARSRTPAVSRRRKRRRSGVKPKL